VVRLPEDEGRVPRDDEQRRSPGQCRDQVFCYAVCEVRLFGIAGHGVKRQDGDRGLVRKSERPSGCRCAGSGGVPGNLDIQQITPTGDGLDEAMLLVPQRVTHCLMHCTSESSDTAMSFQTAL